MQPVRSILSWPAASCLLLLGACASPPSGFDQVESFAWPHPQETRMGQFFLDDPRAQPGLSGVRLLPEPREAFRFRYALAALAEETLDLQYYLWKDDTTGELLLYRVLQAADRGVRVRILLDDIYHKGRDRLYATISAHPNVQIRVFNPMGNRGAGKGLNFVLRRSQLNHRMHNKIFLVDNAVAILGGRNIGDDYFAIDPALNFRDLDVLAVGAVAEEAGKAFDMYWNAPISVPVEALVDIPSDPAQLDALRTRIQASLDERLAGVPYDVPQDPDRVREVAERVRSELTWASAEVIVDPLDRFGGDTDSEFVAFGRSLANQVTEDVVMQTAYLIPSAETFEFFDTLTDRGVRVRVMTNSLASNNHVAVHAHYRRHRKPLLEAGVELYELRADAALLEHYKEVDSRVADSHAGLHAKAAVFDRRVSVIGSYNMDPRSRIWNSEIALMVDSEAFARTVLADMEQEFEPGNAYRVILDDRGRIRWVLDEDGKRVVYDREPQAGWGRRTLARILSWVPIENEL